MTWLDPGVAVMIAEKTAAKSLTWIAKIVDCQVHDGDTLTRVYLDVGWGVTLSRSGTTPLSVRLTSSAGPINAPERTGIEAEAGKLVSQWLGNALTAGAETWLVSRALDRDAYGRCIGEVHVGDRELGLRMLELGLVKRCGKAGTRVPFTVAELVTIEAKLGPDRSRSPA